MRGITSISSFVVPLSLLLILVASANAQGTQEQYNPINFASGTSTNYCVAVSSTSTGTQLRLEICDDSASDDLQLWELDGELLRLKANTDRCARRTGGTSSDVELDFCDSNASDQQWNVNDNQNLYIEDANGANYCWDSASGSSSGSLVEISSCAASDSNQRFDYGSYSEIEIFTNSDRCLSATSTSTGNTLELQTCNGNMLRLWRLDTSTYLLHLRQDPRRCASLSSTSSGNVVNLRECSDGDSLQRWEYNSDNELQSRDRNLCQQWNSEDTGQEIRAYSCDGGQDQEWRFLNQGGSSTDYMRYQVRDNSGRCLGVGSTSVGTQLELYNCDDNDLRLWALNENEQLVLKANSNRCAERVGSGSTVEIQQCNTGDSSQRVRYDTNSDYELRFTSSGQCMQYDSESFGESIITLSCDGASDQEWEQVDPSDGGSDGYELVRLRGSSNRCLGVDGTSTGTQVEVLECDGGNNNRLWRLDSNNRLRLAANTDRCASRDSSSSSSSNFISIESCSNNDDKQDWEYNVNRDYEFQSGGSTTLCFQYDSTTVGTSITARTCDGGSDQEFDFSFYEVINPRGNGNRCMGVDSTSTGTTIELFDCNDSDMRLWYHDSNDLIRLKADNNRCAARTSSSSGSRVELQSCNSGSSSQQFTYDSAGDFEFDSSNLCLQYNSEDVGETIRSSSCDGGSDQEWEFSSSGGGSTDGYVLFPNNGSDCDKCIGVSSVSEGSFLRWINCDVSNSDRVRFIDYPDLSSGGSQWCIDDGDTSDDLCVVPDDSTPSSGTKLKLVSESGVANSQTLLWYYNDAGNDVNDDITHWSSESLCVGVASNGDVEMQSCNSGNARQSWDIVQYDDQSDTCADLGGGGGGASGRDPSATSPGSLIYVNNDESCYDCITITGCPQDNFNCDSARLAIANCFSSDDFTYLKYWTEVPSSASKWCSRDSDWCIQYTTASGSNGLELVRSSESTSQNALWYEATQDSSTTLDLPPVEIQPDFSDQKCVASNGNEPLIEDCTSSTLNPKLWAISTFNQWSTTCDPTGRDPGAVSGMFIHVDTDSDCGWCIGIDTQSNPQVVGLAPCVDSNDNFETAFREGMVPSESNRWCLESNSNICIRYDTSVTNDLSVVPYTGNQNERWYYEQKEITPLLRADMCVVTDTSRNVFIETCTSVALEFREWKIVNANSYSCNTLGVSSFADANAAGLGKQIGRSVMAVAALSSAVLAALVFA
mmetsp:Transcript_6314/g.10535  ORF Transcript_6314/g.10535 Transcript_6314/m.10535 type:complete len:1221 (-) Transcript_6314:52-3714(-)